MLPQIEDTFFQLIMLYSIKSTEMTNERITLFCSILGEALLESHTTLDFVYCSPSLRCVQTAQHILQGMLSLPLYLLVLWPVTGRFRYIYSVYLAGSLYHHLMLDYQCLYKDLNLNFLIVDLEEGIG